MSLINVNNLTFRYDGSEINVFEDTSFNIDTDWKIIKELNLLNTDTEILYRNFSLLSGGEQIKILLISLFL